MLCTNSSWCFSTIALFYSHRSAQKKFLCSEIVVPYMYAMSKWKGWGCLSFHVLSLQNSIKPGLRISFPFSSEKSLKKGRYILFYEKAFSSVLVGVTLTTLFWEEAPDNISFISTLLYRVLFQLVKNCFAIGPV